MSTQEYYWPAPHFSVPADTICQNRAPSPNADHFCTRPKGHAGKHVFEYSPVFRSYSHKDIKARAALEGK